MPRANQLNLHCACESAGSELLAGFHANSPVFVSAGHMRQMVELIGSIHRVASLTAYQDAVLAGAPPIARLARNSLGVFAGFDFHLGDDGPRLIEINTNAGGAMLNAAAAWQHPECCDEPDAQVQLQATRSHLESVFADMFQNEWRIARGALPLETIAIVDDDPAGQFLHPEFHLFEAMFRARGMHAFIADAASLEYSDGRLRSHGRVIDLVYNRLTDFYLEQPAHAALRAAYLDDAAVVTPHPRGHAILANKKNLAKLSDAGFLRAAGASEPDIERLVAGIPLTRCVSEDAESWWRDRKQWFFKPADGFASRGAYRGDKITRRAFSDVVAGEYVAQRIAPPGERVRKVSGALQRFKVDLRHYVYQGATQLVAARLYQGQTTNFRTQGGGFAPVIELREPALQAPGTA